MGSISLSPEYEYLRLGGSDFKSSCNVFSIDASMVNLLLPLILVSQKWFKSGAKFI